MEDVNLEELKEKSVYIFTEYYRDHTEPFFEAMHPNITMLSFGKNQLFEGRETIRAAAEAGKGHGLEDVLRYEIQDMSCQVDKIAGNVYTSLLQMRVIVHHTDGDVQDVNQRVLMIWKKFQRFVYAPGDIRSGWFLVQSHVSVGMELSNPIACLCHMAESISTEQKQSRTSEKKYEITDTSRYVHYIAISQIMELEIIDKQTYVYLRNGRTIRSNTPLSHFERDLAAYGFIRIHKSYLVNSRCISGIKDYVVTLDSGDMLPVSHRKYREIRQMMKEQLEKCNVCQSKT